MWASFIRITMIDVSQDVLMALAAGGIFHIARVYNKLNTPNRISNYKAGGVVPVITIDGITVSSRLRLED